MTLRRRRLLAAVGALVGGLGLDAHPGAHPPQRQVTVAPAPGEVDLAALRALTEDHRFDEARARLEALVREHPRRSGPWLALGDVARVQGRWDQARRAAFQALATGGGLAARALAAAVGRGSVEARLRSLELALAEAGGGEVAEAVAYARGIAAELAARIGRDEVARRHLEAGLDAAPADPVLRAQAADLLGRHEPLRRLRLRLRGAWAGGDPVHARERARYLLEVAEDAVGALAAARENWSRQREGEDARLLLEAAIATGRPEAAAEVLAWAAGYGEDVRLETSLSQVASAVAAQP